MSTLWPISLITFKEGIRDRAVYGILLIALFMLVANTLISGMIPRDIGKVAVDIALSTLSFSGLLLVFFVGINLMAKDLDKRTIYMVLSRPISRPQYILGKFFGMAMLIVIMMVFLSFFAVLSILLVKSSAPEYFPRLSWPMILLAISLTTLSLILLSALSFLFASFTSSSFITLVLTIISYIIGHSLNDVKALLETSVLSGSPPSWVTLDLAKGAYYLFPNLSFFDIKMQAAHALPVASSYIFWVVLYGLVYTSLALTGAAILFSKKELP